MREKKEKKKRKTQTQTQTPDPNVAQILQKNLQYYYNAILKVELQCSSIVIYIYIFYSIFNSQNLYLLSLIISLLFSLFLLSFSSALSSLQTQTPSSSQHQYHTSQWFIFSGGLQFGSFYGFLLLLL